MSLYIVVKKKERKKKTTYIGWEHFLVHLEEPISFSYEIGPDLYIYNVAVGWRGSQVLCAMLLISFQFKLVYIL